MNSTSIQINELDLRVPGLTREQGRKLGEAVAQRLAALRLRGQTARRITSAKVQIRSGSNGSVEVMANEIVASINDKLR
jgi:hypothetical protein